MVNYLLKTLYLSIVSFVVIFTYYITYSFHTETFTWWYSYYLIPILIIYLTYKSYTLFYSNEKIKFSLPWIILYFLLNLFILSILFFVYNEQSWFYWVSLFFQIIAYLFLPTLIVFSSLSFWKFVLKYIKWFLEESSTFQFLFSLWFWFFAFLTLLTTIWFLSYNLFVVFWILILFLWIAYKEAFEYLKWFLTFSIEFDNHKADWDFYDIVNLKLLTTELLFIILAFLISVNLINIVRPMPIGWDDLWVYMNNPQLLANAWKIIPIWGMQSWQVFTWIWYMFKSATQAFFINNLWSILSVIVIILSLKDLFFRKVKTFLNIPLLSATIFVSMPMIIFQQAKDMKLDSWLFFVSAIVVYLVLYIFIKYLEDKKSDLFSNKSYLIYLFLIWILAWFAFSIKLTSLLLISWIIWLIFYSKLWLSWFLAYISWYIWIFTKFHLWDMLYVVYPKDDIDLINKVFLWSIFVSFLLLGFSFWKYKLLAFKRFFVIFFVFLLWIVLALSPWLVRNIYTLKWQNISISWMLNWKTDSFKVDYTQIYSPEEVAQKEAQVYSISSSWTTLNEDLWRYFGYETWINNYLKLPYNLTMQENQRWEYMDITYIFIAFIPVLILFLSFTNIWTSAWYFFISFVPFIFFFWDKINQIIKINIIPDINTKITNIFSNILLPEWYIFIALAFLLPVIYLLIFLDNKRTTLLFKLNLVFASFYTFLWSISAFWIVWYWVTMYYSFLIIIAIWLKYVSSYSQEDDFKINTFKFFWSFITFLLISFYFFNSSFPHGFNNIKNASYVSYKAWTVKSYTSIFNSHDNYFNTLLELNIAPDKRQAFLDYLKSDIKNENIAKVFDTINDFPSYQWALRELSNYNDNSGQTNNINMRAVKSEAQKLENDLYYNILYPKAEFRNDLWIYRIWTFMKYFITNNHTRLYEDSLVELYEKWFYDDLNIDSWIEKMKNFWLNYFLVDLNAATIDKDPRRALTKRYEELLKTFTSDKLELIETDSLCLRFAIDVYSKSEKTETDFNNYMMTAWVNYESYDSDWNLTFPRTQKQIYCYNKMLTYIEDGKVSETEYNYLFWIKNYLSQNKIDDQEQLAQFFQNYVWYWWMTLFRIK